MQFVSYVKSLFSKQELTPIQRYEKKSQSCQRDLKVKHFAVDACFSGGIGGAVTAAVVPMIAINVVSLGVGTAIAAAAAGVFGVAASIWTINQSDNLKTYFDWNDYSDKTLVINDSLQIKNLKLKVLLKEPTSPAYRVGNLKKYGVLSPKFANRMQAIIDRFQKADKTATQLACRYPLIMKVNPDGNSQLERIAKSYQKAKQELQNIKGEWETFQQDVEADLPDFTSAPYA